MKKSMFIYIFILLLALSLVLTVSLSVLYYYSSGRSQVRIRMSQLEKEAEELADMSKNKRTASDNSVSTDDIPFLFPTVPGIGRRGRYSRGKSSLSYNYEETTEAHIHQEYIEKKVQYIHDEYSAYTILAYADPDSNKLYSVIYSSPDLSENEVKEQIAFYTDNNYHLRLMQGDRITEQVSSSEGTIFTIGVPITIKHEIAGGVFIHTSAQVFQSIYSGLIPTTAAIMTGVFLLSAIAAFFLAKYITKPLASIATTAVKMQNGDYSARAPINTGSKEIHDLARSFNDMAVQIQYTDQTRSDFVANVSHELKSPVTSIQGYAEGMLDGTISNDSEKRKYLQIITDETHRLTKLINSLLSLSRLERAEETLKISDFDLCETVRRVIISKVADIERKKLEIDPLLSDEGIFVSADKDMIERVLINLLDNAIKYTNEGGKITLEVKKEKPAVIFRISDNGIGIPEEDIPFIFERFYMVDKAHTSGKGTGLGLAICKKIIEKHGQTIRLVNGNGGCTFEFTLAAGHGGEDNADKSECEN